MKHLLLFFALFCASCTTNVTETSADIVETRSPCTYCGISFYMPSILATEFYFDALKIQGSWYDIDAHIVEGGSINYDNLDHTACLIHSLVYTYGDADLDYVRISFDELERSCSDRGAQWHINLCMAYFCKVHANIDSIRIQRVACGPGLQTFTLPLSDNCYPADPCIGEVNWEAECTTTPF